MIIVPTGLQSIIFLNIHYPYPLCPIQGHGVPEHKKVKRIHVCFCLTSLSSLDLHKGRKEGRKEVLIQFFLGSSHFPITKLVLIGFHLSLGLSSGVSIHFKSFVNKINTALKQNDPHISAPQKKPYPICHEEMQPFSLCILHDKVAERIDVFRPSNVTIAIYSALTCGT